LCKIDNNILTFGIWLCRITF